MGALEHKQRLRDQRCVAYHKSKKARREKLIDFVVASACVVVLVVSVAGAVFLWGKCLP